MDHPAQPADASPLDDASWERMVDTLRDQGPIPQHIAIIMDGNGRWAQRRGLHRYVGHHEGVVSVRNITESAVSLGVQHLTLYTFSTENWGRPEEEVEALMTLLVDTVARERETLLKNGVRLHVLGDLNALPVSCQRGLNALMEETAHLTKMSLHLALSYSGRWEIVEATKAIARAVQLGQVAPEALTQELFASYLPSGNLPDPDLLIRTGGEMRISNFLLWSIAYTELYVTSTLWPDFRREALADAVRDFQSRERRFGCVPVV